MKDLTDNFDFDLIGVSKPFLGYNSALDKTAVRPEFLIRGSYNVYKKKSGTVANRFGMKRRGSIDATEASTDSTFVWQTSYGNIRPLRTLSTGKLQVEYDANDDGNYAWYDLLTGQTNTRFVYDAWWVDEEQKDLLLMCNGGDYLYEWSGGVATVASTAAVSGAIQTGTLLAVSGGSGYAIGDLVNITGGGGTGGRVVVVSVSGTAINGAAVVNPGSGYATTAAAATTAFTGSGSGATFNITATTGYTITKTGTQTWAEAGFRQGVIAAGSPGVGANRLIIGGVEYEYFGDGDSTTLVGFTTNTTGVAAGSVAVQKVYTNEDIPVDGFKADFMRVVENQVVVGSYTSRAVYISADIDFTDFTNAGSQVYGDPDTIIIDSPANGIAPSRDGSFYISGGTNEWYRVTLNTPVGAASTDFTVVISKVEKAVGARNSTALAHEFIDSIGNDVVYLSKDNQLRTIGDFENYFSARFPSLSDPIETELKDDDFTGGQLRCIDEFVHITAPVNGRDYLYEIRSSVDTSGQIIAERIWHAPHVRSLKRIESINGVTYGFSNANPEVYQLWDTGQWHDDSPSGDQLPYDCVARYAYRNHGRRQGRNAFNNIYIEGYMTEGTQLSGNVYFEYQGAQTVQNFTVNSNDYPATFFSGSEAPSLGDSSLGDNPLGTSLLPEANDQELLPKFRDIATIEPVNSFEYCVEFYSQTSGDRWELLSWGTNAVESSENAVFLRY